MVEHVLHPLENTPPLRSRHRYRLYLQLLEKKLLIRRLRTIAKITARKMVYSHVWNVNISYTNTFLHVESARRIRLNTRDYLGQAEEEHEGLADTQSVSSHLDLFLGKKKRWERNRYTFQNPL